jgi:alkanesulfonate monooxygenase SsuD/methylene tetrahydromethanopterin reductase-like flavin-dependent oxidoreductase (luciferase family)
MRQHIGRLEESLQSAGRRREEVKVLWGASIFVAETDAEARRLEQRTVNAVPIEAGLALLSGQLGVDLSAVPIDEPIRNLDPDRVQGVKGILSILTEGDFGEDLTIREAAKYHAAGMSNLRIVGSAEQVADTLENLLEEGGGDGFMLRPNILPGSIESFVELVVPILQARNVAQTSYSHRHLRDNLLAS